MEELLAEPGRQILSAGTPDRALALVREHEVDVVVSDIHLNADRSGLDLLRAVRSGGHPARVVLISGFGTLETAIDAVRHGAFDYVSKPFDIAEVKATVERALTASEPPPEAPTPHRGPAGADWPIAGDARRLQADRARRRRAGARAGRRRQRHRQGAGRAGHSSPRPPRSQAVRADQLWRVDRDASGVGAVWPHPRRIHRRRQRRARTVRAGAGRHDFPG